MKSYEITAPAKLHKSQPNIIIFPILMGEYPVGSASTAMSTFWTVFPNAEIAAKVLDLLNQVDEPHRHRFTNQWRTTCRDCDLGRIS